MESIHHAMTHRLILFILCLWGGGATLQAAQCPDDALVADVVAIDHPMVFNRLGAQNVNWMMYALRHDIVDISDPERLRTLDYTKEGDALFEKVKSRQTSRDIALRPDLRPRPLVLRVAAGDYLRVNFTNLLHRNLKHYPSPTPDYLPLPPEDKSKSNKKLSPPSPNFANPFDYLDPLKGIEHPLEHQPENLFVDNQSNETTDLNKDSIRDESLKGPTEADLSRIYTSDDQVASRMVGFHPQGLELVSSIDDDSSYVGSNGNSLVAPGETKTYCFRAEKEGAYLVSNDGAVFGGEGTAGNSGVGLFGAVTVQPSSKKYTHGEDKSLSTSFYRAQVTEEELRLATRKDDQGNLIKTAAGQPVIDYEATYPDDCASNGVWCREGKAGKPILNIVHNNRIMHGDINAIIVGPNLDGSFKADTYPLESIGERNPTLPNRLESFREFVSIFHDENAATQAFPYFFKHPELQHTLHGVRDSFMINYGSGGIGAEIIANRLKAGPMHDCLDCAYEEFFLSSFAVGDAAMLVDKPANLMTSQCQPEYVQMITDPADPKSKRKIPDPRFSAEREQFCVQTPEDRATEAFYPHDPANVHHSYIGDFVKFRNLHSGKEQHIFHLHNHQWLFNPNDDNSNYIDAQGIGPGSGYTYEIALGGSGNRNKTVGDAIFHCHFYPHFAQGMWYMWRNHDVFEAGTRLQVSDDGNAGFHSKPFALQSGKPSVSGRALPDGEIVAGAPIPAIVPLPGKGMAPMPLKDVSVKPRIGMDGEVHGSMAEVILPEGEGEHANPGFPFWIAGVSSIANSEEEKDKRVSIGSRPTTPPLDMCNKEDCEEILKDTAASIGNAEGHDGGLPRHALAGFSAGGVTHSEFSKLSAEKLIEKAKPVYYDEKGTRLEKIAMKFHEKPYPGYPTHAIGRRGEVLPGEFHFRVNGAKPIPGAPFNEPCIDDKGTLLTDGGDGEFFGGAHGFVHAKSPLLPNGIEFGANKPRVYKGANIQLDVVFNKLGYHYPQQRILALWEDVGPLLREENKKAPEPLVIRMNTFDCAMYAHSNLVPAVFYADDYQITTPTDVIGQHIHLPKWDLTSADGGANGWNYEDGTFSPDMVRERIHAINKWNESAGIKTEKLIPKVHPYFNDAIAEGLQKPNCEALWEETLEKAKRNTEEKCIKGGFKKHYESVAECVSEKEDGLYQFHIEYGAVPGACNWLGARTTLQRWFSDPIVNKENVHRGLGTTFTHDHLGPSTHQQLGLYATMLSEPPGSEWRHNETGEKLYDTAKREDGGPTSWQATITGKEGKCIDIDGDGDGDCFKKGDDSHREFFLQFGDFQHAYVKGAFYGVNERGIGWIFDPKEKAKPTPDSFRFAINPSAREPAKPVFPDILAFEPTCPGGKNTPFEDVLPGSIYFIATDFSNPDLYSPKGEPLRPCPEAISADDIGMMVVNYRNEPIGARVYDPDAKGPDDKKGSQTNGRSGDMAFAMQTRTDRAIAVLNSVRGNTPYQPLTQGVYAGDPFTPILRAHSGDRIKIKIQGGAHEHEHNASINGLSWLQGGSGYGQAPHSGWRNSQNAGLSEQFTFQASLVDYETPLGINDRMYTVDASQDGLWNGVWGAVRSYTRLREDLTVLPSNPLPSLIAVTLAEKDNSRERMDNVCPSDAEVKHYTISAVLVNEILSNELGVTIPQWKSDKYEKLNFFNSGWKYFSTKSYLSQQGGSLIFNARETVISIRDQSDNLIKEFGTGPLHDPTAIVFVLDKDLDEHGRLKKEAPLEPLVLRAAAGDCIQITLKNRLPRDPDKMPDLYGYTSVSGIIPRNCPKFGSGFANVGSDCDQSGNRGSNEDSMTSFNNNMIRPSNHIGLHPQMAHYDVQASDGSNIGLNAISTVAPGETRRYTWYAGMIEAPVENCETEFDEDDYAYLRYFGMPFQGMTLSSGKFLDPKDDLGGFVGDIHTMLSNFNSELIPPEKEQQRKFADVSKLYEEWRSEKRIKWMRSQFDNYSVLRNKLVYWLDDKIEAIDNIIDAVYAKATRVYFDNPFNKSCENRISEMFNGPGVLFDRGKMAYALKEIAECRGSMFLNPSLIDSGTTRLLPIEKYVKNGKKDNCKAHFVSIESGGSNLTPPDRIKQGQKGAIGALVVEPEGATWEEKDKVADRQQSPKSVKPNLRFTRTMADVAYKVQGDEQRRLFRDLVLVHQKGLNLRYKDGRPVANLAAEKEHADEDSAQSAPEDAHDSGHMAINYGTEPMWFRFGLPPDAPFGKSGLGGADSAWQAFSNECCSNGNGIGTVNSADKKPVGEPYVPVMKAYAGQEMRIRALMPTGTGRGSTVELHGHGWMRDPYLAEFVNPEGYPGGGNFQGWGTPSKCIGANALAMQMGGQESLTPMAHFDLIFPRAGGKHGVTGDYLWRDHAGFGITNGLWAIIRIEAVPDGYDASTYKPLRTNCNTDLLAHIMETK